MNTLGSAWQPCARLPVTRHELVLPYLSAQARFDSGRSIPEATRMSTRKRQNPWESSNKRHATSRRRFKERNEPTPRDPSGFLRTTTNPRACHA